MANFCINRMRKCLGLSKGKGALSVLILYVSNDMEDIFGQLVYPLVWIIQCHSSTPTALTHWSGYCIIAQTYCLILVPNKNIYTDIEGVKKREQMHRLPGPKSAV